jgi:guanylate kinase
MWNDELLQKCDKGVLFVISAPAGAGKTTLVKQLLKVFPSLAHVPSITTRPRRPGEIDGVDYTFVSPEEFKGRLERGEFLEDVFIHGHHYATSRALVDEIRDKGRHVILVIDTRGALAVQKQEACVLIFIKPPSLEVLNQRLNLRGTESEEDRKKRLEWAKSELMEEERFDFSVVNDRLERAFDVLASIVVSQTHRLKGNK